MRMLKKVKEKYIYDRLCPKCHGNNFDKSNSLSTRYFDAKDITCISCGWKGREVFRLVDLIER